jgi:effector-binding domain-containing protein
MKKKNMKTKIKKCLLLFGILSASFQTVNAQSIERVVMQTMKVVYVVDTAATAESISPKMGKGYGILFSLIGQQQLKPGEVLAIYHNATPPWIFDIAVQVDREPVQLTSGVQFKTIEGGDAIVVHYKGSYDQIHKAYQQMEEWFSKNNKQGAGPWIEVYLNDPAMVKDKNELLTDVYQLIK